MEAVAAPPQPTLLCGRNSPGTGEMPPPKMNCSSSSVLSMLHIDDSELSIFEKVGEGVAAEVYRGEYRGTSVAVKEVQLTRKAKESVQDKVLLAREIAINSKISYEYLVQFYGIMTNPAFRIITEFCGGGTLFDLLHNKKNVDLSWSQRHKIMTDVACGMNYLHEFKPQIIHRDLKSLNLLLCAVVTQSTDIPHVKVADFGLARMKDNKDEWVKMTPATGTSHWMAPEVFGCSYDASVDVYSYAMVLFEVICRRVPFQEVECAVVERYTKGGVRPGLGVVPQDCPKQLVELMVECWAQDSKARPSFGRIIAWLNGVNLINGWRKTMAKDTSRKGSKIVMSV